MLKKPFAYPMLYLLLGTIVTLSILTGCHNKDSFEPVVITTVSRDVSSSPNIEALEQKPVSESKAESNLESVPESKPQSEVNTKLELWEMDYDTYFSQERKFEEDIENTLELTTDGNKIVQNHTEVLYQADGLISDLHQSRNHDLIFFVKGTDTKTICRLHLQSGKMDEILSLDSKTFRSFDPKTNESLIWWTQETPEWIAYIEEGGDWELPPKGLDRVHHYQFNSKTGEQKLIPESEYDPYEGKFEGVPRNSAGVPILGEDFVLE